MRSIKHKIDIASYILPAAYGLIVASLVYTHTWEFQASNESLTWQQPGTSSSIKHIHPENYSLKFAKIEDLLSEIQFNKNGNLALFSHTASTIERILERLPKELSETDLNRFEYLVKRVFPHLNHDQLTAVILKYQKYTKARDVTSLDSPPTPSFEESKNRLKKSMQIKRKYFGVDIANGLFLRQYNLGLFIIERRNIVANKSLNKKTKALKLEALKASFKNKTLDSEH